MPYVYECVECKNEFNEDEGDFEFIVNNEEYESSKEVICDYCMNWTAVSECQLCSSLMLHSGLDIPGYGVVCLKCIVDWFHDFIQTKIKENPCFPWIFFDWTIEDPDDKPCETCGRTHPSNEDDDIGFYPPGKTGVQHFVLLYGDREMSRAFTQMMKDDPASPLIALLKDEFVPFVIASREEKRLKKQAELDERRSRAKRMIREFCPNATEDEAQEVVAKKCKSMFDDCSLEKAEQSFLEFVAWLAKND